MQIGRLDLSNNPHRVSPRCATEGAISILVLGGPNRERETQNPLQHSKSAGYVHDYFNFVG